MSKLIYSICLFLWSISVFAQRAENVEMIKDHMYHIGQLKNSKDNTFQEIVKLYDLYIRNNPDDIDIQIERCKFIGKAYYDEYDDYNTKYNETEACIEGLFSKYPSNSKVLIYRAENLYGEERLKVLKLAKEQLKLNEKTWENKEISELNRLLGDYYIEKKQMSNKYYLKAQLLNDSLDLSLQIARNYKDLGKPKLAKELLLKNLKKDTLLWSIKQKANLLLELNEPEKALELFNEITDRDSTYIDYSQMAKTMIGLEKYEVARSFLVKDTVVEWSRIEKMQNLFSHDLKYSSSEIALDSYRRLQKKSGFDDLLGVKRIKIAFKYPFLGWSVSEILSLVFLLFSFVILLIVPYLWVLPVYSLGMFLQKRKKKIVTKTNFKWGIKHFWLISFLYLVVNYLLLLVYYYEDTLNSIFSIGNNYTEIVESDLGIANGVVFFVICSAVFTLILLDRKNIKLLFISNIPILRMFSLGIGFVIFNMILLKILGGFINLSTNEISGVLLNPQAEILALLKTYGFWVALLLVAVVGPIYEEIIFRGVVLGAVEKQIGFVSANIFQAVLFGIVHFDLNLFLFYFVFGLLTGYAVNKTKGLLAGIILHGVNNLFVLLVLYFMNKMLL